MLVNWRVWQIVVHLGAAVGEISAGRVKLVRGVKVAFRSARIVLSGVVVFAVNILASSVLAIHKIISVLIRVDLGYILGGVRLA